VYTVRLRGSSHHEHSSLGAADKYARSCHPWYKFNHIPQLGTCADAFTALVAAEVLSVHALVVAATPK